MRECNFDGLVGPTHNFGGWSLGNVASEVHRGEPSNPRAAALQGLAKMRFVAGLGLPQAVLPPHPRPSLATLRRLGFEGSDGDVLAKAAKTDARLIGLASSAAAMWAANAATVAPSCDTTDGRLHVLPANLQAMFHRSIEADTTTRVLRAVFADASRFVVHDPLPGGGQLADEGAANHTRLVVDGRGAVHVFAWGRSWLDPGPEPARFPARQTREASEAVARSLALDPSRVLYAQQHPDGIDAGAFHTDVLAVGNGAVLLMHELAFVGSGDLVARLRASLGEPFHVVVASVGELPASEAVGAYPFNSQLLTLADGSMSMVAPTDSRDNPRARAFLERVLAEDNPVRSIHYVELAESMHNGGGPACLRLRVPMTEVELAALGAGVLLTDTRYEELTRFVEARYRDRLLPSELADPELARESMAALDELTSILQLGSVYDFQR